MKFRLTTRDSPARVAVAPTVIPAERIKVRYRNMRVLDFDIENRPLTYLGSDFTTGEVTAISWAWDDSDVTVRLLGETDIPDILREFVAAWDRADLVSGHYCRGHDIPMINGALLECGMPPLADMWVSDTKLDLVRMKGISRSQESLSEMQALEQSKVHMTQFRWRAANRLTPAGLAYVRERVIGDVRQHMALRRKLMQGGYLGPAKLWKSGNARVGQYQP